MKGKKAIRDAEKYLTDYSEYINEMRGRGLMNDAQRMRQHLFMMEDAIRKLGFTVKSNGTAGYEIKCKWSDAPEGINDKEAA